MPRSELDCVEIASGLLDTLGTGFQFAARLAVPRDLRKAEWERDADLSGGDHGSGRAGREYSSEGTTPRKPGLRVFMAPLTGQRGPRNSGRSSEGHSARFNR